MKRTAGLLLGICVAIASACSSVRYARYEPALPNPTKVRARVFLVGDAGIVSFEEAEVPEQAEKAEKRVERSAAGRRVALLPAWARPKGGEKKVFKEILNEVTALAVKNARQSELFQTLKGEAKNHERLAPGVVPVIVWLGDNVYKRGVPRDPGDQGYKDGELTPLGLEYVQAAATLVVQAQVGADAGADSVFVAGNHDWDSARHRGPEGRERVIEQGEVIKRYIEEKRAAGTLPEGRRIRLLPQNGCPGPAVVDVPITESAKARIVAIDTEWLLVNDPDRGCVEGGRCRPCDPGTREGVYAALRELVQQARPGDALLVTGHHPLMTYGEHGGQIFWHPKTWLRWLPLSAEDMPHSRNRQMREALADAYDPVKGQPLLYAAGHEHNLQLLRLGAKGPYVAVSGAASKLTPVRPGNKAVFTAKKNGYMVVDFEANGRVLLYVVEVSAKGEVLRHPPVELRGAGAQSAGVSPEQ